MRQEIVNFMTPYHRGLARFVSELNDNIYGIIQFRPKAVLAPVPLTLRGGNFGVKV